MNAAAYLLVCRRDQRNHPAAPQVRQPGVAGTSVVANSTGAIARAW